METTWRRWMVWGLSVVASGAAGTSALGCDRSCEADATCVYLTTGGDGLDAACPADPADGPVRPDCGIWVSGSRGQDTSPGTQDEPVRTLAQAIALAQAGSKRVYACGETYAEAVRVPSGVSLFGGFDCENRWTYTGTSKRAKIHAAPGDIALTFLDGDERSLAGDLEARSPDAVKPGGSSMAVLVQDLAKGSLRGAAIVAGNGADGADGEDGMHEGNPKDGLSGMDGTDACTAEPGIGGASVKLSCGDGIFSLGGPGGDGGELVATSGGDGLPLPEPNPANYGLAGKGEEIAPMCTGGTNGVQGAPGADGGAIPQIGFRRLTNDGAVLGGNGGDGAPGLPGQGGGGGGASYGKAQVCGAAPAGGAGGGSGGTGGCGGRGGKGGQAGGASIGLAVRSEKFTFFDIHVTSSNGGNGGKGGQSQPGGQGGLPGGGGQAFGGVGGVHSGCFGGGGGNGGNGGNGAGGRGGDATAVALVGDAVGNLEGESKKDSGAPGRGGDGGSLSAPHGSDGLPGPYVIYDP